MAVLPTNRTEANTDAEHVADHNELHDGHNLSETHRAAAAPHAGHATTADLDDHINDAAGAHAASAISVAPFGSIASTNTQAALEEIVAEASGGVTDHGALDGLADDDHPQYHNDARGDARYQALYDPVRHSITAAEALSMGHAVAYAGPVGVPTMRGTPTSSSGTTAVAKPTGVVAGDVIYIAARNTGQQTACSATGFTEVKNVPTTNDTYTVLRRVADGSEGSTFTVTNQDAGAVCIAFSGVDNTTPEDVVGSSVTSGTNLVLPSVSPTSANTVLVGFVGRTGGSTTYTWTPPATMTEQIDAQAFAIATQQLSATGATGTRTFEPSTTGSDVGGFMLALRPGLGTPDGFRKAPLSTTTSFVGFAAEAIAADASGDLVVAGATGDIFSGLTPGSAYYLGAAGAIATTGTKKVGVAVSATELVMNSV